MSTRRITPIHYRRLVTVFELDGFTVKRQKGDHLEGGSNAVVRNQTAFVYSV